MNRQINEKEKWGDNIVWIMKSIGVSSVVSIAMLLILAVILWKLQPKEQILEWGIRAVYVLAAFLGGFFAGRIRKKRKFLCGLIIGILYYLLLVIVSVFLNHSLADTGAAILPVLCLCLLGGMFGGMLA